MKRRVLIVGRYVSSYGGAHKYLENLVEILINADMRVLLVIESHPDIAEFCGRLKKLGATLISVPFDNGHHAENAKLFDRIFKEYNPHLIDCEVAAKTIRYTLVKSECMKDKTAVKLFTMHLAIKSENPPSSFLALLNPLSSWHQEIKKRKDFISLFDFSISVSEYHAERIEKVLGLARGYFKFIPNGVDIQRFRPSEGRSMDDRPIVIGGCGSLTRQKRFDLLINAIAIVAKENKNLSVKIAGEGPEREKLEDLILQLGLTDVVELCGLSNDMPCFFQQLDLFVMCSDNEGFPYALLEAMSTGLPSIVTKVGDMPHMVNDGINGAVIRKDNQVVLADAIFNMIKHGKDGLALYGESARKVIEDRYDKKKIDHLILNVYRDLGK